MMLTKEECYIELYKRAVKWEKEVAQYMKPVEEARKAKTEHDQILSMATALRQCVKELKRNFNL